MREVVPSGWLTTAGKRRPVCRAVRRHGAGVPYARAVNSRPDARHPAREAVGDDPGQSALVPTITFTTMAEVIQELGADPVLPDVESGLNLLTSKMVTRAIEQISRPPAWIARYFFVARLAN